LQCDSDLKTKFALASLDTFYEYLFAGYPKLTSLATKVLCRISFCRLPQTDIPCYKSFVHVWDNISLWTSVLCDEHQQNKAVLTAHTCSFKWHPESGFYTGFWHQI